MVAHAGAGEVDDGVAAHEAGRVDPLAARVPRHLPGAARGAADQADHLVAVGGQGTDEGAADEAARAGDGDAGHSRNRSHSRGRRSASALSSSRSITVPRGSAGAGASPRSGVSVPVICSYASSAA